MSCNTDRAERKRPRSTTPEGGAEKGFHAETGIRAQGGWWSERDMSGSAPDVNATGDAGTEFLDNWIASLSGSRLTGHSLSASMRRALSGVLSACSFTGGP
jgi:hypothetical protein